MMTNHDRAKFGRAAIAAGVPEPDRGEQGQTQNAIDTIVNVLHAAREGGMQMEVVVGSAIKAFTAEREADPREVGP